MTDQPRYYDVPFNQNKDIPVETPANPGIETTTWFDQSPTHPPVPPDICRMEEQLADAIARADALLEKWLHDSTGTILFSEVNTANEYVVLVQDALYHLRDLQHGRDCTCDPTGGNMCSFCWHERQYKKYMQQCCEKET